MEKLFLGLFLSLAFAWPAWAQALVEGPWVQSVQLTSAVVMWEASTTPSGTVDFGLSAGNLNQSVMSTSTTVPPRDSSDTQAIIHEALITGLTPNTTYFYQVEGGVIHSFATLNTGDQWTFAANTHINSYASARNKDAQQIIRDSNVDFVIFSGDIGAAARNINYRKFMDLGDPDHATWRFYCGTGNHDTRTGGRYADWFYNETPGAEPDETYYVQMIGNIRFIFLRDSGASGTKFITEAEFPTQWFTDIMTSGTSADWHWRA